MTSQMKVQVPEQKGTKNSSGVDKGRVAMFLRMSPEERLRANDSAIRTIPELRSPLREEKPDRPGSGHDRAGKDL